jgi:hypothetical protein
MKICRYKTVHSIKELNQLKRELIVIENDVKVNNHTQTINLSLMAKNYGMKPTFLVQYFEQEK